MDFEHVEYLFQLPKNQYARRNKSANPTTSSHLQKADANFVSVSQSFNTSGGSSKSNKLHEEYNIDLIRFGKKTN